MLEINFNYYRDILQYIKDKSENNEEFTMKDMYSYFVGGKLIPNCDYFYNLKKIIESDYTVYDYEFAIDGGIAIDIVCLSKTGYDFLKIAENKIWDKVNGGFNSFSGWSVDNLKKLLSALYNRVNSDTEYKFFLSVQNH